jgi:hypothetical protein
MGDSTKAEITIILRIEMKKYLLRERIKIYNIYNKVNILFNKIL